MAGRPGLFRAWRPDRARGGASIRLVAVLSLSIVSLMFRLAAPEAVAAGQSWQFVGTPTALATGVSTTVRVTVTNNSGNNSSGEGIGCVRIAIPAAFVVTTTSLVSVSGGHSWSVSKSGSGPTTVTLDAASDSDRIVGSPSNETVVVDITGSASAPGSFSWTGDEFNDPGCGGNYNRPLTIAFTVTTANTAPVANADSATHDPRPDAHRGGARRPGKRHGRRRQSADGGPRFHDHEGFADPECERLLVVHAERGLRGRRLLHLPRLRRHGAFQRRHRFDHGDEHCPGRDR